MVTFLVAITKCQLENDLKEERVILAHSLWGKSPSWWSRQGGLFTNLGAEVSQCRCLVSFSIGWWLPIQGGSSLLSSTFWKRSGMCFPGDSISRKIDNDNHHKSTPCQFDTEHITLYEHSTPHGHINTKCIELISKSPKVLTSKSSNLLSLPRLNDNLFRYGSL